MDWTTIEVRWNYDLGEWETYSPVLKGWTVANNLQSDFDQKDIRRYFAPYGRKVKFCAPVPYFSGQRSPAV